MQEAMFIKPIYDAAIELNTLFYNAYVTKDNINFIPPFQSGTRYYIFADPSEPVYAVNDLMITATTDPQFTPEQQAFIYAQCVTLAKTEAEAIQAGWFDTVDELQKREL